MVAKRRIAETHPTPPEWTCGLYATPVVTARLCGISLDLVEELVRHKLVSTMRRRGRTVCSVEEIANLAIHRGLMSREPEVLHLEPDEFGTPENPGENAGFELDSDIPECDDGTRPKRNPERAAANRKPRVCPVGREAGATPRGRPRPTPEQTG